jgi:hypothetical protein
MCVPLRIILSHASAAVSTTPTSILCTQAAQLDGTFSISRPANNPTLAPIVECFPLLKGLALDFLRGVEMNMMGIAEAAVYLRAMPKRSSTRSPRYVYSRASTLRLGLKLFRLVLSVFSARKAISKFLPALKHINSDVLVYGDGFDGVA